MHIDFQNELDPEQYAAVTTTEGPVLIIAGAGSGKTRVITYRIAYLLAKGVPQEAILALTFTNKAAKEMVERAHSLTGLPLKNLMVSTFHSFGAWLLRKEANQLGYRSNFSIYDEQDRVRAIHESANELGIANDQLDFMKLSQSFSALRAGFGKQGDLIARELELYDLYRKTLKVYNAVDFDDLIALPLELFQSHEDVRRRYQSRFRYIMIDEFQDTSLQQYECIRQIESGNICAVGDDDQSIYSWRGADYRNIERFELDHPGLAEIKLERNYRSTGSILTAANTVIARNTRRKKKQLWSPQGIQGTPISLFDGEDDEDEAEKIITNLRDLRFREHADWDDFGILVRTNSLAESIENKLVEHNIPYRVAGGPSFYQRREIKDIIAYLKAAVNPDDDVSVLRVLNVPRRGVGRATVEFLSNIARSQSCSLKKASEIARQPGFPAIRDSHLQRSLAEVFSFFDYLAEVRTELLGEKTPVSAQMRKIAEDIGYWQYLLDDNKKNDKVAVWKFRNIELLASSAERWEKDPDTFEKGIFAYLARISLMVRDDTNDDEKRLSLLTIHAAKGLEFKYVFIPGFEKGLMPHARSLEDGDGDIEEERRLFYVALTRAKKQLFISRALQRKKNGSFQETEPSPFLEELPQNLLVVAEEEAKPQNEEELRKEFFRRMREKLGA